MAKASAPRLTADRVAAFRLARHHLSRRAPRRALASVVGDVCGVQAQVAAAARLSLRARVQGLTPEDVERALWRDRTLVKTWAMRGAVHLLPAVELPTYLRALARREMRSVGWMTRRGLPMEEIDAIVDATHAALEGGPLTRRELGARVSKALGPRARRWVEHGWGGVVRSACIRGRVCFGPNRGIEVTFVRLKDWLPRPRDVPPEEAGAGLLRRFLHVYGPATVQDFARWADLAAGDARSMWGSVREEIVQVDVEGRLAWALRGDLAALRTASLDGPVVRLLPNFDVFLLGHVDKGHLVDPAHYKRVYRKAGWISQVLLVDGRVAGVWTHRRKGSRLLLAVEPFTPLSRDVREGVEAEAADIGRFLGAACEVTFV